MTIKLLVNADDVVDVLSKEGALTPAEIADRVQMPRPSVYRLLDGLHAIGLTEPLPNGTAQLSLRWLHLADRARSVMQEWAGAHEALVDLVDRTGQTAYLSVLRNDEAVCLDWEPGRAIGVLLLKPGRSLPLHAGAAGRTLLAYSADLESYLASSVRRRFTPVTLVDDEELRHDAMRTLDQGYAVSDGDVTDGIGALGVPVLDAAGSAVGVVSLAGLAGELRDERDVLVEELHSTAARMGALPPA